MKQAIESGEITWPCWWEGGKEWPIATRWGVRGFPTVYVLDGSGVIRYKDVRGDELTEAVSFLVDDRADPHP